MKDFSQKEYGLFLSGHLWSVFALRLTKYKIQQADWCFFY